ncbi:hypothetical protein TKK_0004452 [Trichogramma kaykai]|uniref:Dymeclin n=1 Tax=Trichogramma kaykai TaxID=54128 RepID=A0ABD2XN79_9HYME
MGASPSKVEDLSKNTYLERFCSKEPIPLEDDFWNHLLSYNIRPPLTRNDQIELDSRLDLCCQQLLVNNQITGNIGTLIQVTLIKITELLRKPDQENIVPAWQTFNSLFAVRCILKYLIETVGEEEMVRHTEAQISVEESNSLLPVRLQSFIEALVGIMVDVPLCEFTYIVHLEAINCLLVLLSVQLFSQTPAEYSTVYRIVMNEELRAHAPVLVCTLLNNFAEQTQAPPGILAPHPGSSIVFSIAAGLWNVITFGISSTKNVSVSHGGNMEEIEKKRDTDTPLASQSLLLLLVLTNHCTQHSLHNSYREALFTFTNVTENCQTSCEGPCAFKFNVDKLYRTICKVPNTDEITLLLYMLLHRNSNVKQFIMKRLDLQSLIVPILKILYNAPDNTSHHIYMSLIILLILSEDESFNKSVHDTVLKGVTWYTERSISEISLGGLLILVVIRTIQYNMLKMRDRYLHTNCLAALANMSSQFRSLHPYVSQRLISLFETLAKKHTKLEATVRAQSSSTEVAININNGNANTDLIQDLTVLEEVLRMVLEIINSTLTHQLAHNQNLIYTLLYKKDVFQPFRTHSSFQDIIQNVDSVISFFSVKLEEKEHAQIGVTDVLETIKQGTSQWPRDRLRKFPELKFKYVEEEQPEEFFIPYVWSVVYQSALLHWSAENIKLFLPSQGEQTTVIVC